MIDALSTLLGELLKAVGGMIVLIVLLSIPIAIYSHFRFKALARKRAGLSICQFARSFDYRRVDTRIIRAVYETFQDWTAPGVKDFPVMATDETRLFLGWDDGNLDYLAESVAKKCGRRWDNLERNPFYGRVNTVGDVVMFVTNQPLQTR